MDPELDLGGVLCIKELRRVVKDNTVQCHGRTLQLYPTRERPSYSGAWVEVQERLDGSLLVRHRGKLLIPQEASALATELRNRVSTGPVTASPVTSRPGANGLEATTASQSPGNPRTPDWGDDLV